MSRVLLVGAGPLPDPERRRIGFPQLRTAWFAEALGAAGHEVLLCCLRRADDGEPASAPGPLAAEVRDLCVERGAWIEDLGALGRAWRPAAWVAAGPYAPPRAAALAVGALPLWADVPGDPFAEAQALAARLGTGAEPLPDGPLRAQAAAFAPALARADAFSVCSAPQADALLGQLGLAGRLALSAPGRRWVEVLPPAWGFGLPQGAPRRRDPGAPLTVALAGGFNTWLDEEALLAGLLLAMDRGLPIRVVAVGGGIAGHFEAGWERFRAGVAASVHAARFALRGWLPHGALPAALAPADCLVSMDRPGAEPRLGSRTRLLFGLHQGLEVLSTPASALARDLAARGFLHPVPAATPEALAEALAARVSTGSTGETVAEAQRALAASHAPAALCAPLAAWAARAERAPAGADALQLLAERVAAAEAALAAVHATPTWRIAGRWHGLLRRLRG